MVLKKVLKLLSAKWLQYTIVVGFALFIMGLGVFRIIQHDQLEKQYYQEQVESQGINDTVQEDVAD